MARHSRLACLVALLAVTSAKEQTRWSRQISSYTSDISDWVPLTRPIEREPIPPPIKRQAIAEPRILSEPAFPGFSRPTGFSPDFPSRTYFNSPSNRQLYLQSVPAVPSAPQNYLSDQGFGQGIRFGLQQPNFPFSQGFVGPQFAFDNVQQIKQRPQSPPPAVNPIKFESFPKQGVPVSTQAKPFNNQGQKKLEPVKFVDGYRVENVSNDFSSLKRKPQSLQKIKFENFEKVPKTEMIPPNKPKLEKEEVQLLYVPVESLNRGQFNFRSPLTSAQLLNTDSFPQNQRPSPPKQQIYNNEFQRPIQKPLESFGAIQKPVLDAFGSPQKPLETFGSNQDYYNNFNAYKEIDQVPKFSTLSSPFPTTLHTTPKPKRLKPHQPPLAIFLTQEARKGPQIKVGDVLSSLKSAETIAVLDSVHPDSAPKVFIGPSSLTPPPNFVKFELPYLSNIEHTDKKLRQLPFFVAPLSYQTPQGFAKIPFPSPHVGSVVINSQIKETSQPLTTTTANITPNSYSTSPQSYREPKPVTQKPTISYYSTAAPKTNPPVPPSNYQSNYYSFEPQTVSTVRPPKEPSVITSAPKTGSYFLSNIDQYNPSQISFDNQNEYKTHEPVRAFNVQKQTETTPNPRTTPSTTTAKPSTYPSQLLETHNPYSINQAFHFSTPLDYHNFFDDGYATPGISQPPSPSPSTSPSPTTPSPSPSPQPIEPVTERQKYQSSPNYLQNYSPEIHYESDLQSSRYPIYNNDYTPKPEISSEYNEPASPVNNENNYSVSSAVPTEYNGNVETQSPVNENTETINKEAITDTDALSTRSPYYSQYETSYEEEKQTNPTTSTTTTTTRRTPIRSRGRPRYTTTPKTDSNESITKTAVTRRPLRERRPLPTRPRYEPNKITTERATRKPVDYSDNSPKYSRNRTRGRVHYKHNESDEYSKPKGHSSKEADLAYQRDVLHQNYPVTLMERTSTLDIEAITEPSPKVSSTKIIDDNTEIYDTENAYSNDRALFSQNIANIGTKEEIAAYTSRSEIQTETPYTPKSHSTRNEEYYHSRSSSAPVDAMSYDETSPEREEESYGKQTTPVQRDEKPEVISYATEPTAVSEQNTPSYSINNDYSYQKQEEITTPDAEITKEQSVEEEPEENIVQTTPSYNRVRVRPGVIRQYHQASTTESARTKSERRRPVQAITYRPAFDRRRTTMRIDEIEADLKTKQVHTRPEVQEHRHPVYRPDPTTEASVTSPSTQDSATKRGVFRRRRPTYTTTSTEASSTRKSSYEVKSRFRGRRPTEKPTEKTEVQTDTPSSTVRNTLYSRYSNRPRLSERYKKPEPEESEDQESNYSINRPKFVEPESDQWSPKISTDSFKPYNPNEIKDDQKIATTERRSSIDEEDGELDIITAKNEYEDILISVTPATNNRVNKKIPDIPPTLEALVEQSKVTKNDAGDKMSTFESMLEEVMKSLEEQDEDEYTSNVMKHKGGEIGEIPPDRIITSDDNVQKTTTVEHEKPTTVEPTAEDSATHNEVRNQIYLETCQLANTFDHSFLA